ncbi:BRO-N domain-containing protein [Bacillus sp. FSL L8-0199]|uniref:BRO-N domain-containing protein n=1 Tax=Bacillus sp. FSL L8-0199 TaxID=2954616 RepID=UPI004046DC58
MAEVLGYSNTSKSIQMHVDDDGKSDLPIRDGRQTRKQKVINESLILSSKLPNAKKFKKWVTSGVPPQQSANMEQTRQIVH